MEYGAVKGGLKVASPDRQVHAPSGYRITTATTDSHLQVVKDHSSRVIQKLGSSSAHSFYRVKVPGQRPCKILAWRRYADHSNDRSPAQILSCQPFKSTHADVKDVDVVHRSKDPVFGIDLQPESFGLCPDDWKGVLFH